MNKLIDSSWGPLFLVFLGALLSACGALWASVRDSSDQHELRRRSDEIATLNKEIMNQVTGGDSYCVIVPVYNIPGNTQPLFVAHVGKYNVYDTTAVFTDLTMVRENGGKPMDLGKMRALRKRFDIGTVVRTEEDIGNGQFWSTNPRILTTVEMSPDGEADFAIEFTTRSGAFLEFLLMRRVNQKIVTAIEVLRGEQVIQENIDPEFPREADGSINWGKIGVRWTSKPPQKAEPQKK